METNLVLSLGSIMGIFSLFYAWHKEQKTTSNKISVLENKMENLSERMANHDMLITQIQQTLQQMDLKLTRIDTQLSQLIEDRR